MAAYAVVRRLLVVVGLVHIARHAKVSELDAVVAPAQDVARRQVAVDDVTKLEKPVAPQ